MDLPTVEEIQSLQRQVQDLKEQVASTKGRIQEIKRELSDITGKDFNKMISAAADLERAEKERQQLLKKYEAALEAYQQKYAELTAK